MTTLKLDEFTVLINLYKYKAAKESDVIKRTSYLGEAGRLERKRNSLSIILFGVGYKESVERGIYEPWIEG